MTYLTLTTYCWMLCEGIHIYICLEHPLQVKTILSDMSRSVHLGLRSLFGTVANLTVVALYIENGSVCSVHPMYARLDFNDGNFCSHNDMMVMNFLKDMTNRFRFPKCIFCKCIFCDVYRLMHLLSFASL